MRPLRFLWLEITGKCQLECVHCYADSGPKGTHGSMTTADWRRVLDEGTELGMKKVQFIGGEPTLHPDLPMLISHARAQGLDVEVFSNLVHISEPLWKAFSTPGVSLATSYYSDDAEQHAQITLRPSYVRTKVNIAEAVRRSIPLRVAIGDLHDAQRAAQAEIELQALGVTDIKTDRLRGVGRGAQGGKPSMSQLCGNCTNGVAAVANNGDVWPCVFSRWLPVGNVRHTTLSDIMTGSNMAKTRADLEAHFAQRKKRSRPIEEGKKKMQNDKPSLRPISEDENTECGPGYHCAPRDEETEEIAVAEDTESTTA